MGDLIHEARRRSLVVGRSLFDYADDLAVDAEVGDLGGYRCRHLVRGHLCRQVSYRNDDVGVEAPKVTGAVVVHPVVVQGMAPVADASFHGGGEDVGVEPVGGCAHGGCSLWLCHCDTFGLVCSKV